MSKFSIGTLPVFISGYFSIHSFVVSPSHHTRTSLPLHPAYHKSGTILLFHFFSKYCHRFIIDFFHFDTSTHASDSKSSITVTQNIPASVPFSSVPAFQGSAVRSASAGLHALQRRKTDFEEESAA